MVPVVIVLSFENVLEAGSNVKKEAPRSPMATPKVNAFEEVL